MSLVNTMLEDLDQRIGPGRQENALGFLAPVGTNRVERV